MTCAEIDPLLCDYVDGTLYGESKAAVEQHLASCTPCARLVEDMASAVAFIERAEAVEPPPELVTRLLYQAPTGREKEPSGWRGFFSRLFAPAMQPRLAMGMAMTILSFSLVARFAGIEERQLRPADLKPAAIWHEVNDRFYRAYDEVVKHYRSLQVVYEIQTRLSEWGAEPDAPEAGDAVPPQADPIGTGRDKDDVERSEAE